MIEEQALVVAVSETDILIEANRQSACGQCARKSDCGQSAIAQWAASKMVNISVLKPEGVSLTPGDTVVVGINEYSFLKASVLLYFVPLLFMFIASYLASRIAVHEWQVIIVAMLVLIGSFYMVRIISKKLANQALYQLQILKVLS